MENVQDNINNDDNNEPIGSLFDKINYYVKFTN